MKKKTIFVFLMLLISACSTQPFSAPERTDVKVTLTEADHLAAARLDGFKDNIELTIRFEDEESNDGSISLIAEFQNISKYSIVFKKPRSAGFASTSLTYSAFNDLNILVMDENNNQIKNVIPTSQFIVDPRMRDIIQCYIWHQREDFIVLQPDGKYEYELITKKPFVLTDGADELLPLPNGKYLLSAIYSNDYIGYQDVDESEIKDFNFLFEEATMINDINAWVGKIVSSNTVLVVFQS